MQVGGYCHEIGKMIPVVNAETQRAVCAQKIALSTTETGSWETQCSQMLPHHQDYTGPVSKGNHAGSTYHWERGCPKRVC